MSIVGIFVATLVFAVAAGALPRPGEPDLAARAELLALRDGRSADLAHVVPLAGHPDGAVRAAVAAHLGSVPFPGGAPVVVRLLADRDPSVRGAAAMAAGRLLRDLPAAEAARGSLSKAVREALRKDKDPGVRAAAAWGLAAAGGDEAAGELLRALVRDGSSAVRVAVLQELWRLPSAQWVAVAVAALDRARPAVERFAAAWSLARSPAPEGSPAAVGLRRAAADPDPTVRAAALAAPRRGARADLWDLLTAGALDAEAQVRLAALDSLAAVLEREGRGRVLPEAVARRVRELVTSRDAELVHERVLAIRLAGLAGCCAAELAALAGGSDPWPAEEALVALGRLGADDAVRGALQAAQGWRRRAGVRAARHLPDGASAVRAACADEEAAVRLAAVEELAVLGGEEALAALRGRLHDPDAAVRAAAVGALEKHRALPPVEELLGLLRREGETSPDAAVALVRAVAAALPREEVRRELEGLAQGGGDPVVARAAWEALGRPGAPPPVAVSQSPQFYREVAAWAAKPRWLELVTVRGSLVVALNTAEAALASFRLARLAEEKFFDGLTFHRVVPNFVVQGGDPRGDGWGGPGWSLRDELSLAPFLPGVVGLALAGPDTAGSQLFVTLTRQPHLDGRYPVLGRLTSGMDVAKRLRRGDRILRARTGEGEPPQRWPVWYGELSPARLDEGMPGWREERERYTPHGAALARLASASLRYELEVAMGTWCSDSHEQIPRLQKVLAELGERSPFTSLRLWGVDRSKELAWPYGAVELVPTIVVTFQGGEVGRIVETPASGTLEWDLVRLLAPLEGWPDGLDDPAGGR